MKSQQSRFARCHKKSPTPQPNQPCSAIYIVRDADANWFATRAAACRDKRAQPALLSSRLLIKPQILSSQDSDFAIAL